MTDTFVDPRRTKVEAILDRCGFSRAILYGLEYDLYKRTYLLAVEFQRGAESRFAEITVDEKLGTADVEERVRIAEILAFPRRYRRFSRNPRRQV